MNAHLAYESKRAYVFQDYYWNVCGTHFFIDILLILETLAFALRLA